ncbi:MAG: hypothetical protein ACLS74_02665 [Oscillibacter sp.]
MPARKPKIERIGNMILLKRDQWKDHTATISDYPGLLDEVMKYTWTYYESDHPYLKCGKLNTSLHKFVLAFLYGADQLNHMLNNDNIIEHLDNDGLNCAYDNLHIISADYNKAKAFTIDKERALEPDIPSFITDVYYSHEKHYYQMQVFFNRDVFYNQSNGQPIEELFFQYNDFRSLYIDWVYIYGCRQQGAFDLSTFHMSRLYAKNRPIIYLTEDEQDHVFIQRDGQWFLRLNPDGGDKTTFLNKTVYQDLE